MAITYTPTTNFGAKDSLPTNDPDKVIKGSEFTTEFTAIQTAFSLAAPAASPTFTGTVTIPTADINGGTIDGATIGGASAAAGSFTTLTASDDVNFDSGTLFVDASADKVGIGTTSPSRALDVQTSSEQIIATFGTGNTTQARLSIADANTTTDYVGIGADTDDFTVFAGGSERIRVDDSGNVGIGNSSPAALLWPNGSTGGLFLQAGGMLGAYNGGTYLSQNYYYNAGEKFIGNGGASRYVQSGQEHIWSSSTTVNASGAGAALTWSEAMRIDSSGNVGIGTTSPAQKIHAQGSSGTTIIAERTGSNAGFSGIYGSNNPAVVWGGSSDSLRFAQIDDTSFTNFTERMRIDSSGNFLVGTTTNPGGKLSLKAGSSQHGKVIASNGSISGGGETAVMAEGVVDVDTTSLGTVLSIPITSQGSRWRRFIIEFMFSSGEYNFNNNANGGTATVSFASLTSLTSLSLLDSTGNVASVSSSGTTLQINFTSGFTGGLSNYEGVHVYYKVLSTVPTYFQMWNATLN